MFVTVKIVARVFTTVNKMVNHIFRQKCAVCMYASFPVDQTVPLVSLLSVPPVQLLFLTTLVFPIILLPHFLH